MTDIEFVGHTHAAVELNRVLANEVPLCPRTLSADNALRDSPLYSSASRMAAM